MEEEPKLRKGPIERARHIPPIRSTQLWCGKVQGLCDGTLCVTCHLFPKDDTLFSVERDSTIDKPTLTDHKKIGMTREEEEDD